MSVPHSADIFQAKSESLASLLPEIDQHKAALPNFQREWVWEAQMVAQLIVSVANRYPAGSLLTMPNARETFALRPFSGSGETLKTVPTLMVLDGQQRLTSLYQSLYSKSGVRDKSGNTYFIYLNVKELMTYDAERAQDEQTFEECIITIQLNKDGQKLYYRGLRDFDDVSTRELEVEHGYLPLFTVFNHSELDSWRDQFIHSLANKDFDVLVEKRKEWDEEVAPWLQRIRDYRFPVIELNKDMELHAICHIFEKVNSTGVPLTVFELCTAILWAKGVELNSKWDQTKTRLHDKHALRMQGDLDGTAFLQTISLLATLNRKLESPESRIAVSMRREALLKLEAETVNKWWDSVEKAYEDASRFMLQQGIIAHRLLPYTSMLPPLAAILAQLRTTHSNVSFGATWPMIERWYWCSVFGNRYSSTSEYSAAIDVEQVIKWIGGGEEPDAVRNFTFPADRLLGITTIRNVVYKGVLCLLAKNGAKDFSGEGPLSTQLFYDMSQDHHHIFPKAALDRLGIHSRTRESIINKTLIGSATNRSIGGRQPSQYLSTMRERLGKDRVDEIMRSHLIDPETLENDDWEQFVLARREAVKALVESTCGGGVTDFSDGLQPSLPSQIQRLCDSVRDVELNIRNLIAKRLDNQWSMIPDHIRPKIDERIQKAIASNPGLNERSLNQMEQKLSYADLRELETIMTAKPTWSSFEDVFGTKESLQSRFKQIGPLRNATAHHREISDLEKTDAQAAVIWFDSALSRSTREQGSEVEIEETSEDESDEIVDVLVPQTAD